MSHAGRVMAMMITRYHGIMVSNVWKNVRLPPADTVVMVVHTHTRLIPSKPIKCGSLSFFTEWKEIKTRHLRPAILRDSYAEPLWEHVDQFRDLRLVAQLPDWGYPGCKL